MEARVIKRKRNKRAPHGLKPRKLSLKTKLMIALSVLAALAAAACSAMNGCVGEPVRVLAEERVRMLAANTMSFAVIAALEEQQGDMLSVTKTNDKSYIIIADTAKINRVAGLASADALERMGEISRQGISIDTGDLSGLYLLGGKGPKLDIGFTPVGSITAETVSSLRSSGINQSVYSVELILTAHVQLVIAGKAEVITVKGVNPICETVIVGEVPQVYTNVANEEDMLNLVPTELP